MDRFSKSCRLIPLKNLPTAMETAEQMFNQVFGYFSLPEDIVSDRGPQFISRVWKNFLELLGVTVSLSSGYHLQTNGQTERNIQEIGRFLQTFCHGHQFTPFLEPVYWLGRVRQEFPSSTIHWTHSLPVHARFPATFVPLGRGTIRCTCSGLLVPREREGLGRSTPPCSTSYGQAQIVASLARAPR